VFLKASLRPRTISRLAVVSSASQGPAAAHPVQASALYALAYISSTVFEIAGLSDFIIGPTVTLPTKLDGRF